LPDNNGASALDEELEKLNIPDNNAPENRRLVARYSDVDILGHATAYRYVEWVCDSFPFEQFKDREIDWIQLNYINETKPGETILLSVGQGLTNPKQNSILGTNLETGLKAFESVLMWK
jgi:acyl-ACP thioesterase